MRTSKPVLKKNLSTQGLETRTQGVRRASQNQVGLRSRWQLFFWRSREKEVDLWFLFSEVGATSSPDSPAWIWRVELR